ncbi:T9SS type A sorting domain-containing protein [bacterium]|nr:T9SS type A sorting domain-containing protein [bacterium]
MNRQILLLTSFVMALLFAISCPVYAEMDNYLDKSGKSGATVTMVNSSGLSVQLEFELKELSHEQVSFGGGNYDKFTIDGETVSGAEGLPELPHVARYVLIPPQSGVDVRIIGLKTRIEPGINPLPRQPLQEVAGRDTCPTQLEYVGFYPSEIVELGKPAIMRGYRIIPVIIHPVRWNSLTGEVEIVEELNIELDFSSEENRINLVENPERKRPSIAVHNMVSQLVINPPPPPRRDDVRSGSILYVTQGGDRGDDVVEELQSIIEWRRRMGWTVEVLQVNGNNDPNAVRREIIDVYENAEIPPEHIVICGDAPHGGNQFTIGFWDSAPNYMYPYETDHSFGCLEGDDVLPEASVGRLPFASIGGGVSLRGILNKTILYESEPYIGEGDDVGWQKRGAVTAVAGDAWSSIDMCRWAKQLFLRHGYDEVGEAYYPNANEAAWIPEQFDDIGISMFVFRGHLHMGGFNGGQFTAIDQLDNGRMLPFAVVSTCNTGDYAENIGCTSYHSEKFAMHPDGGAIGCVGTSGGSHTTYNNLITCGCMRAPFVGVTTQGWALVQGKLDLYRNYVNTNDPDHHNSDVENWLAHIYLHNLMGDPAVDLFTDVPQELVVDHPAEIRAGETHFEVSIAFPGDEEDTPAENVQVCLYKPEEFQIVRWTSEEGIVIFDLDPEWTEQGEIQLTVTGHNLMTYLEDFEIVEADHYIGSGSFTIDDDENGNSNGDDDETANPTEILELTLEIVNFGSEVSEGEMTAVLTAGLPDLEVSEEANSAQFDAVPEPGEAVEAEFVVVIGGAFPHGENAVFLLDVYVSEEDLSWQSSVSIPVVGPQFELASFEWYGDPLESAGTADFNVTIRNTGVKNSPAMNATLVSLTPSAEGVNQARHFDAINVGEEGGADGAFRVNARVYHLGGQRVDLALVLESESGFRDSVFFAVYAEPPESNQPFGPDGFGYMCVDDTDTSWFEYPVFEWVEIDPNLDGPGTDTELHDAGSVAPFNEDNESVVMELPFTFRYYDEDFDFITITTNGWMALGRYYALATACNRRIPGALVAPAMLCPFWDDLYTPDNSGIYTWYDEENNRFIVEWSGLRKLNHQSTQTFQVILPDPEYNFSFNGGPEITFQYLEIDDDSRCDRTWDTPYATVGIGNPDMNDGLEYTYFGNLTPGAAPIENERAIRFTTMLTFDTGLSRGVVDDPAHWGDPMEGVTITASYGYSAITGEDGSYLIEEMLADTLHLYDFMASKWGWNDSTLTSIEIVPDEVTVVNFGLLHPEFTHDVDEGGLIWAMNPDDKYETSFRIINTGNGTMHFTSRFNYVLGNDAISYSGDLKLDPSVGGSGHPWQTGMSAPPVKRDDLKHDLQASRATRGGQECPPSPGGAEPVNRDSPDEIWDMLLSWNASEATDDMRMSGITLIGDHWYLTGHDNRDTTNYFYQFNLNGEYIDSLDILQPVFARYGITELDYYNGYIYAVAGSNAGGLLKIDPATGQLVNNWEISDAMYQPRNLTINRDNGHFFISGITSAIHEFELVDDTLEIVSTFQPIDPRDGGGIRCYGFAWFMDDPDGQNLYLISEKDIDDNENLPDISLYKVNVNTNEVTFLTSLGFLDPGSKGRNGIFITPRWNNMIWVLAVVLDNSSGDEVCIFELGLNSSWIRYQPRSDTLNAGEFVDILINLDTEGMNLDRYEVNLEFTHNAIERITPIRVVLDVTDSDVREEVDMPLEFDLSQNYPNPFNSSTAIGYSVERNSQVKLTVYDITGRTVKTLIDDYHAAGQYRLMFDASVLANGIYIYKLESEGRVATKKMVVLK